MTLLMTALEDDRLFSILLASGISYLIHNFNKFSSEDINPRGERVGRASFKVITQDRARQSRV